MKRLNRKGFTLVEVMIVVAIIALLAAIAIPNLIRARISANDASAQRTLRTISTASETYATVHAGNYPGLISDLTGAVPPFLNRNYCTGTTISGFTYGCAFTSTTYTATATPSTNGGTTTFTITTGGVLTPIL